MILIDGFRERGSVIWGILSEKRILDQNSLARESTTYIADRNLGNLLIALLWGERADLGGVVICSEGGTNPFKRGHRVKVMGVEY